MDRVVLKELLSEMAEQLDAPDGPGGGAILLEAVTEIDDLERRLPPHEPSTS